LCANWKFEKCEWPGIFEAKKFLDSMTATKTEQFNLVEDAVKTGIAPAEIAAAFSELTALRQELKKLGEPERYYLKAMNCPHHHRIFAASHLGSSN
jgi:hypothetical protein